MAKHPDALWLVLTTEADQQRAFAVPEQLISLELAGSAIAGLWRMGRGVHQSRCLAIRSGNETFERGPSWVTTCPAQMDPIFPQTSKGRFWV